MLKAIVCWRQANLDLENTKCTFDNINNFVKDSRLAFINNEYLRFVHFLDISTTYDNVVISLLQNNLYDLQVPMLSESFVNS